MDSVNQWLHQHDLLLGCAALLGIAGLDCLLQRRGGRAWLIWSVTAGLCASGLWGLRTSAASLSEHRTSGDLNVANQVEGATHELEREGPALSALVDSEPELDSVEAIEESLASSGKPTLVEIYADHGFS